MRSTAVYIKPIHIARYRMVDTQSPSLVAQVIKKMKYELVEKLYMVRCFIVWKFRVRL